MLHSLILLVGAFRCLRWYVVASLLRSALFLLRYRLGNSRGYIVRTSAASLSKMTPAFSCTKPTHSQTWSVPLSEPTLQLNSLLSLAIPSMSSRHPTIMDVVVSSLYSWMPTYKGPPSNSSPVPERSRSSRSVNPPPSVVIFPPEEAAITIDPCRKLPRMSRYSL